MNRRGLAFGVLIAIATGGTATSFAGNNAGGTARLSWNRMTPMADLTAVPSGGFPLYLLLDGVADVRTLAVNFRWTPNDPGGPCYVIGPNPVDASGCGLTTARPPDGGFQGQSG